MRAIVAALCISVIAAAARAEDDLGLDRRLARKVTEAGRAYLDPELELVWRARKAFTTALAKAAAAKGIEPLADIAWLRRVVMQSRHFLPPYSDRRWQREQEITRFWKSGGGYSNIESDTWRITWTVPRTYRHERVVSRIPRRDPLPLLLAVHEERDVAETERWPERTAGSAVLERAYPRDTFRELYEKWFLLAPIEERARFLNEDGGIRHDVLTRSLTEFWRRYHVDFDRIVLDGGAPAAALAATYPNAFAGLVLRDNPTVDLDVVGNYATVPVFVAGDARLARELELRDHPDVTVGDDEALLAWLGTRRRAAPTRFVWRWKHSDHRYAQWIHVIDIDQGRSESTLDVRVVDTAIDPNTIRIEARGIERIQIFLNDEIVDLDLPVRLVINGRERMEQHLERDFDRVFQKDPQVRRNMNFGWLYTVLLEDIPILAPDEGPSVVLGRDAEAARLWERVQTAECDGDVTAARLHLRRLVDLGETAYLERAQLRLEALRDEEAEAPGPGLDVRLAAEREWLEGRPDRLERHLGPALETMTGEQALPFALRDLWWRRTGDDALRAHVGRLPSSGLVADQFLWILGGGVGPYPTATEGDPWPILTALVRERQQRETTGTRWLPDESPVLRRRLPALPAEWQDWYGRWCTWFYEDWMRPAYEGVDPATLDPDYRDELAAQDRRAQDARRRNLWLSLLAGLLFVGGACLASRRLSQAR